MQDKSIKIFLGIISSAILYAIPAIASNQFGWLACLFLIPLYYTSVNFDLSFKQGFAWGFLTFALHEWGIFYSISLMAEKYSFYIFISLSLFLLIYQAIFSGIWFYINKILINIFPKSCFYTLTIWSLTTWLYFYFINYYLLTLLSFAEGYILLHPLLPLAAYPTFLLPLFFISAELLLFFYIVICAIITAIITCSYKKLNLLLLAFLLIILGFLIYKAKNKSICSQDYSWRSEIVIAKKSFYNPDNPDKTIVQTADIIKKILKQDPQIKTILFPESALFLLDLSKRQFIKNWSEQELKSPVNIILGAARNNINNKKNNNNIYNTIYWYYNGKLQKFFDKKHAMALTEQLPNLKIFNGLTKIYFKDRPPVNISDNTRPIFKINKNLNLIPIICSEMFFLKDFDFINNSVNNFIIAAFCNDTWIKASYIENLMGLTGIFRAIEWQKPIIYIAYKQAQLYTPCGNKYYLKSI